MSSVTASELSPPVNISSSRSTPAEDLRLIREALTGDGDGGPGRTTAPRRRGVHFDIDILGWGASAPMGGRDDAPPRPAFVVRLVGPYVLLAPLLEPDGPCASCLGMRWKPLRPVTEWGALEEAKEGHRFGRNPWLTPLSLEVIRESVEAILERREKDRAAGGAVGEVYSLSLAKHRLAKHLLLRDSMCPACAVVRTDTAADAVLEMTPRPKRNPTTYREHEFGSLEIPQSAMTNPFCGVLGPFQNHNYSHPLTSPAGGEFQTRGTKGEHPIWWAGHTNRYAESAWVGFLEGLERHAGLLPRRKEIACHDSYRNLQPDALNPEDCGVYKPEVYHHNHHYTMFDPDLKFNWVWGYSLTERRPILVPAQLAYYADYVRQDKVFVFDNSNGCSIGASMEEAVYHGLMELIERDAFLITWFASLSLPHIDPWSSRQPQTLFTLDRLERLGLEISLLDMRLDIPVPSILCVASRRDRELGSMVLAAGASLDPERAIRSALNETSSFVADFQERVTLEEAKAREMMADYSRVGNIHDHPLLYGIPEMADKARFLTSSTTVRTVEEAYHDWQAMRAPSLNLLDDINFCIELLGAAGLKQVIVVDQTTPEQEHLGLKTAAVIVPGLLPIDFGYGRDRSHALPRRRSAPRVAGFRATDLTEAEFNPLPHPFP